MYFLGLDLGGTKIEAAVVDKKGNILSSSRVLTKAEDGSNKVLKRMCDLLDEVLSTAGLRSKEISGLGIGVPGAVDQSHGMIYFLTNLPGWTNFPVRDYFQSYYNIPVAINNDANAAALGEHFFGSGMGVKHMIYITVSTGIGGGIIVNGNILNGVWGSAGEIGHMVLEFNGRKCNCGSKGCWETISSGSAIAQALIDRISLGEKSFVTELVNLNDIKAEHVFKARQMGDKISIEITDKAMDYLGLGIANLVNIINPERIIIGGGVSKVGDLLFERVRNKVQELAYGPAGNVRIQRASLDDKTGVIGAAALAMGDFHQ
ncbi:MAG: hypothetical protein APF76_04890 [Desulfitibacter sp. BRH_c19]|nr:MAG: hypothetical protein APF76_04890 [Desulfitibacter sp. BRH_c19]